MTASRSKENKTEQFLIEEFIKDLESTTEKVQILLEEIRDSKIKFAAINTELKFLLDNVKELSSIIKDGGNSGSILTRLALIEASVCDIKTHIDKDSNEDIALLMRIVALEQKIEIITLYVDEHRKSLNTKTSVEVTDKAGKWKLYVAIATGTFTLIGTLAALLIALL